MDIPVYGEVVNSNQFRRWLAAQGCTFEVSQGKGGHVTVYRDGRKATLPMHGGAKQLKTGLMAGIKKELGID